MLVSVRLFYAVSQYRMSRMRQRTGPKPRISVPTLAWYYKPDFHVPEHSHNGDHLIYATTGVMEVFSVQTCRFILPNFAARIPARVPLESDAGHLRSAPREPASARVNLEAVRLRGCPIQTRFTTRSAI
jgi:hypothetical protein